MQNSDCRDIFKLTIKLKDGNNVVESFVHQEELTWTGLKDFNYTDTVGTNDYGLLTGVLELYGIDAGYPVGYYGPQFSDPSITIDYQTALQMIQQASQSFGPGGERKASGVRLGFERVDDPVLSASGGLIGMAPNGFQLPLLSLVP